MAGGRTLAAGARPTQGMPAEGMAWRQTRQNQGVLDLPVAPPNTARLGVGAVAQMGERLVRNEEVRGSIPLSSTTRCLLGRHTRPPPLAQGRSGANGGKDYVRLARNAAPPFRAISRRHATGNDSRALRRFSPKDEESRCPSKGGRYAAKLIGTSWQAAAQRSAVPSKVRQRRALRHQWPRKSISSLPRSRRDLVSHGAREGCRLAAARNDRRRCAGGRFRPA